MPVQWKSSQMKCGSIQKKTSHEASQAALFQHTWTFDRFLNLISMDGQKQHQQCKHN